MYQVPFTERDKLFTHFERQLVSKSKLFDYADHLGQNAVPGLVHDNLPTESLNSTIWLQYETVRRSVWMWRIVVVWTHDFQHNDMLPPRP